MIHRGVRSDYYGNEAASVIIMRLGMQCNACELAGLAWRQYRHHHYHVDRWLAMTQTLLLLLLLLKDHHNVAKESPAASSFKLHTDWQYETSASVGIHGAL